MTDSIHVKLFKQVGASPNPTTDSYLGIDTTIVDGAWELPTIDVSGWGNGDHTIYAMCEDLAGNSSMSAAKTLRIGGLRGLLLDDWNDNKLSSRDNFGAVQPGVSEFGSGDFLSTRPEWSIREGSVSASSATLLYPPFGYTALVTASMFQSFYTGDVFSCFWRFRTGGVEIGSSGRSILIYLTPGNSQCCGNIAGDYLVLEAMICDNSSETMRLIVKKRLNNVTTVMIQSAWNADTDWHSIGLEGDGNGGFTLFFDGQPKGSCSDSINILVNYASLRRTSGYPYNCYLDWLRIGKE